MVDYTPLSDEDVFKLADEIYRGVVFTDRNVDNIDDIPRVFIPLIFLNKDDWEEFKKYKPDMIYEYISKAGHMSINGMPIFFSFRYLNVDDTKRVIEKYKEIKKAVDATKCEVKSE